MKDIETQTPDQMRNEINFRRQLTIQGLTNSNLLIPEALNKKETLEVLSDRISKTKEDVKNLIGQRIILNPYLELGAERVQRALVLENEFNCHGFAVDISFDSLKYAEIVADHFKYDHMPIRIACDAYNLPFHDSSIPFTFSYQTLHHFPDPTPICMEVNRILKEKGIYFVSEEPVKGSITKFTRIHKVHGHRLTSFEELLNKLNLLGILTDFGNLERRYGVLEEEFNLNTWLNAFANFQMLYLQIRKLNIDSSLKKHKKIIVNLFGGFMDVLLKVKESNIYNFSKIENLLDLLICPNCETSSTLEEQNVNSGLACPKCKRFYPKIDGIYFIFKESLGKLLYPHILH